MNGFTEMNLGGLRHTLIKGEDPYDATGIGCRYGCCGAYLSLKRPSKLGGLLTVFTLKP